MLDDEFAGSLDVLAATETRILRERLLALPGVGGETADAILLYALGHPVPVADEYMRRLPHTVPDKRERHYYNRRFRGARL